MVRKKDTETERFQLVVLSGRNGWECELAVQGSDVEKCYKLET